MHHTLVDPLSRAQVATGTGVFRTTKEITDMVALARSRQIFLAITFLLLVGWFAYHMETAGKPFYVYPAPPFELKLTNGEKVSYPGKRGPMLVIFCQATATQEELELDLKALKFAKQENAQSWVVAREKIPDAFMQLDFVTKALDSDGSVAARFPAKGESVNWVIIDASGTVRWSGPRSPMDLKAKLSTI